MSVTTRRSQFGVKGRIGVRGPYNRYGSDFLISKTTEEAMRGQVSFDKPIPNKKRNILTEAALQQKQAAKLAHQAKLKQIADALRAKIIQQQLAKQAAQQAIQQSTQQSSQLNAFARKQTHMGKTIDPLKPFNLKIYINMDILNTYAFPDGVPSHDPWQMVIDDLSDIADGTIGSDGKFVQNRDLSSGRTKNTFDDLVDDGLFELGETYLQDSFAESHLILTHGQYEFVTIAPGNTKKVFNIVSYCAVKFGWHNGLIYIDSLGAGKTNEDSTGASHTVVGGAFALFEFATYTLPMYLFRLAEHVLHKGRPATFNEVREFYFGSNFVIAHCIAGYQDERYDIEYIATLTAVPKDVVGEYLKRHYTLHQPIRGNLITSVRDSHGIDRGLINQPGTTFTIKNNGTDVLTDLPVANLNDAIIAYTQVPPLSHRGLYFMYVDEATFYEFWNEPSHAAQSNFPTLEGRIERYLVPDSIALGPSRTAFPRRYTAPGGGGRRTTKNTNYLQYFNPFRMSVNRNKKSKSCKKYKKKSRKIK